MCQPFTMSWQERCALCRCIGAYFVATCSKHDTNHLLETVPTVNILRPMGGETARTFRVTTVVTHQRRSARQSRKASTTSEKPWHQHKQVEALMENHLIFFCRATPVLRLIDNGADDGARFQTRFSSSDQAFLKTSPAWHARVGFQVEETQMFCWPLLFLIVWPVFHPVGSRTGGKQSRNKATKDV